MNPFRATKELEREIAYRSEQLTEMAQDISRKIYDDQAAWLDKMMQDILPPALYEAGRHGDNMEEIGEYLRKHEFMIVHVSDSLAIRIMRGKEIHAQFIPQFTVDGEPVVRTPTGFK